MSFKEEYTKATGDVLAELQKTLDSVDAESLEKLRDAILEADQVFFVGVGRVMLALQCVCKRLAHLGIKAHYVGEITEPAITEKDLLIVGSGSGAFSAFRSCRDPARLLPQQPHLQYRGERYIGP